MQTARCACGAVTLTASKPPHLTALCHCLACQRRTGSPFSANAFYAVAAVSSTGTTNVFVRRGDSGRRVHMHFCPGCGSTVFWKADATPDWIGVGVGSFADPSFMAPTMSVFEQSRHHWVRLDDGVAHFQALP